MTADPSTVARRPTPRIVQASSTGPHCSTTTTINSHAISRERLFITYPLAMSPTNPGINRIVVKDPCRM
jgi:hypothetical protein